MSSDEPLTAALPVQMPAMGWLQTLAIFGAGALLLFVATHVLVPLVSEAADLELILCWFLIGGLGVFVPLLVAAVLLLRQEHYPLATPDFWIARLGFRRMNRADWAWAIGALVVIGALSAGIQLGLNHLFGGMNVHPSFMAFEPLAPGRHWIMAVWLPFWVLNIMGEEILWRGVMLPRQKAALGDRAWIANALGWFLFHLAFGWQLLLLLLPILVILPCVVQRRQNSWVGVFIHAGLNGPSFIAVAFGVA